MTATDAQVRVVMRERLKGRTQQQAAVRANLRSRRTVSNYERLGRLPSAVRTPRTYRTRSDPFAATPIANRWAGKAGVEAFPPDPPRAVTSEAVSAAADPVAVGNDRSSSHSSSNRGERGEEPGRRAGGCSRDIK